MKFNELTPGRYQCRIIDWGLSTVPQLNDAWKVTIEVSIDYSGEPVTGWWEGLAKKKDGTVNEKTLKTLLSAGFKSTDLRTLNTDPSALDTQKQMEITIIRDDKGRVKAEWLNSESKGAIKKSDISKKDLVLEGALAQALKNKANKNSKEDSSDDLPF